MTTPPTFDEAFRNKLETLIAWRRDVREFRADPPPADTLERLIGFGAMAPSVGLSQPWRFVVVEDPKRRAAVRDNFGRCNADALNACDDSRASLYARLKLAGFDQAPVQFAVFADPTTEQGHALGRRTMPEMVEYSTVVAIYTMWLMARAEGLGLGWVSILDPAEVAAALDVPPEWRFIGYFCLGYPAHTDDVPALERAGWEHRHDPGEVILRR